MADLFEKLTGAETRKVNRGPLIMRSGGSSVRFSSTDLINEGFWMWNPRKNIVYYSDRIIEDTGLTEISGTMSIKRMIDHTVCPDDRDLFRNKIREFLSTPDIVTFEVRIKNPGPENISWIRITARKNTYANGRIKDISGIAVDITANKNFEARIHKLMDIKDALLDINHHMAATGDLDDLISFILSRISQSVPHIDCASFLMRDEDGYFRIKTSIGYDKEAVKEFELPAGKLFFGKIDENNYSSPMIINNVHRIKGNFTPVAKTDKGVVIKSTLNTPINIDGKLVGIISLDSGRNNIFTSDDIEIMQYVKEHIETAISKYKLYEEIKFISRHDQLTGLINRNYFEELFRQNIKLAKRHGRNLSITVIDLDGLKLVNDNYGHLAGDVLITTFTKKLKSFFRDSDIFSRFGGDEFVALFIDISKDKLEEKFIEFTRKTKNEPIDFNNIKIVCSFSYGIATFPEEGETFSTLFKLADSRMYMQKNMKKQNNRR